MPMKTSVAGLKAIEQREGRKLGAYQDSVGVWTIGVGHTGRMAPPVARPGMKITEAQCEAYLAADLAPVEAVINRYVKVPVSQNEFDALASWLFNVGAGDLKRSTILKRLNLGDIKGAANGFDLYHKPAAIIGRRNSEKAQFLTPDPLNSAGVSRSTTVAAARASALTKMAAKAASQAASAKMSAATSIGLGVGVGAGLSTSHPSAAVSSFALGGLLAILQGVFSWWSSNRARTLTTNASAAL